MNKEVDLGKDKFQLILVVSIIVIPSWMFGQVPVYLNWLKKGRELESKEMERCIGKKYSENIQIYTNTSEMLNDKVGISFVIPDLSIEKMWE